MSPGDREQQDEDDDGELVWGVGNCESLQLRQDFSQLLFNNYGCCEILSFSFRPGGQGRFTRGPNTGRLFGVKFGICVESWGGVYTMDNEIIPRS